MSSDGRFVSDLLRDRKIRDRKIRDRMVGGCAIGYWWYGAGVTVYFVTVTRPTVDGDRICGVIG